MATRAQELYYEALTNKQNRDARNPILESAQAGWASGISGAMKTKQEDVADLKKTMFAGALKTREQMQALYSKVVDENNVIVNGDPSTSQTAEVINAGMEALRTGKNNIAGIGDISFVSKIKEKTPETEADKEHAKEPGRRLARQHADKMAKLGQKKDYTARAKTRTEKVDPATGEKIVSELTQEGKTVPKYVPAVPGIPAIPGKSLPILGHIPLFNKIKFGGKAEVPEVSAYTEDVFEPAGTQTPAIPADNVEKIVGSHYTFSYKNPQNGTPMYSDDNKNWVDGNGKQIQPPQPDNFGFVLGQTTSKNGKMYTYVGDNQWE